MFKHSSVRPIDTAPTAQWYAYRRIGSTMDYARMLHLQGSMVHGSIVSTRYQQKGRGQTVQRKWVAPYNSSVLMTLLVDRSYCTSTALSLRVGLGLIYYLEQTYSLAPHMRWPNDIMINDKKIAGILTQQEGDAWLIGIGLNCLQSARWCSKHHAISLHVALTDNVSTSTDSQSTSIAQPQYINIKPRTHIISLAKTVLKTLLVDNWHSAITERLWRFNRPVIVSPHTDTATNLHATTPVASRSTSATNPLRSYTATVCGIQTDGVLVVRRKSPNGTGTLSYLYSGSIR